MGSLVGVVPIAVQDVPVLSSPQNQQCVENSTQAKGDEPLSHVLDQIPVLSGNGVGNKVHSPPAAVALGGRGHLRDRSLAECTYQSRVEEAPPDRPGFPHRDADLDLAPVWKPREAPFPLRSGLAERSATRARHTDHAVSAQRSPLACRVTGERPACWPNGA